MQTKLWKLQCSITFSELDILLKVHTHVCPRCVWEMNIVKKRYGVRSFRKNVNVNKVFAPFASKKSLCIFVPWISLWILTFRGQWWRMIFLYRFSLTDYGLRISIDKIRKFSMLLELRFECWMCAHITVGFRKFSLINIRPRTIKPQQCLSQNSSSFQRSISATLKQTNKKPPSFVDMLNRMNQLPQHFPF